ncbi:MAG: hypothetical protein C4293_15535 [Nitrospiraceae bacterium]
MLRSLLSIHNWYWAEDRFCPPMDRADPATLIETVRTLRGQFAGVAADSQKGTVRLIRDHLGINKLFFAIHESGEVAAANHLIELVKHGIPMEGIFSVPAGHILELDVYDKRLTLIPYFKLKLQAVDGRSMLEDWAVGIRRELETWFERLARHFGCRHICVCLSGGLDSGLIGAFAKRFFDRVTCYTYGYVQDGCPPTDDAAYARQLAQCLGCPFRFVPATACDVMRVVERALVSGQDWRDFNVHCAIVNELLAEAIEQDWIRSGDSMPPLVLTGDLMNELLSDYSPITYGGREYYRLPRLDVHSLRSALVKGLDAGDREVGVFARHGLDLIQPYGLLADRYLELPTALVCSEGGKQRLVRAVASDLLPAWIFERRKVRAQIGTVNEPVGILPTLVDAGCDENRFRSMFCRLLGIQKETFLNSFIRLGRYRYLAQFPDGGVRDGYLTRHDRRSC